MLLASAVQLAGAGRLLHSRPEERLVERKRVCLRAECSKSALDHDVGQGKPAGCWSGERGAGGGGAYAHCKEVVHENAAGVEREGVRGGSESSGVRRG